MSNTIHTTRRVYQTFFGFLENQGGFYETVVSLFALLMSLNSIVVMEVNMLNYIVLKDQEDILVEPSVQN